MRTSGRHGSIPSGELESLIVRNSNGFLSVRRAGSGDGAAGIYNSVTGDFHGGLGGGRIPEWSYMREEAPRLVRGWRNIVYELLHKRLVRPTHAMKRLVGDAIIYDVIDYGMTGQPMFTPEPTRVYIDGSCASGTSGL